MSGSVARMWAMRIWVFRELRAYRPYMLQTLRTTFSLRARKGVPQYCALLEYEG